MPRFSRSTPLLIQLLPEKGFCWHSKYDKPFLTCRQARHITKSMKRAGRRLDEDVTAEYLTKLFLVARELIGRCGKLQPHEFWGEVGSHLAWARSVDGTELHDFSNRILSARNSFNDKVQFYREFNYNLEDIPEMYRTKVDDELHRAMDEWVYGIQEVYGPFSETRQLYYPQWLVDSDNEGTAESTMARFEARVDELRRQRGKTKHNDEQETGLEEVETDGHDMEMEDDPMEDCEEYDEEYDSENDGEYDSESDEEYDEDYSEYDEDYDQGDYSGGYDSDNDDVEGMDYEEDDEHEDVNMQDTKDDSQTEISVRLPFRHR